MQGIVFTNLIDMIEETAGLVVLEQILDKAGLEDDAFVSTSSYEDSELVKVVTAASEVLGAPAPDLIRQFGSYLFSGLANRHQNMMQEFTDFKQFLLAIESVIHVEVAKLYPQSSLPIFDYEVPADGSGFTMIYRSPRKLCFLAEGLIAGAGEYFGVKYTLEHPLCMHNGANCCRLEIRIED